MDRRENQGSDDLDRAAFGSEKILLSMTEDEGVQKKNSGEKINLTSVMATEKWVKCVTKADSSGRQAAVWTDTTSGGSSKT